ncbi:MAG TPA: L-threonylcarbamoyladenylate synthase [Gemmatimonadales bacterium]|nr:L-threonylcarbamoyladenylate synthase [Gemmatimonadales bacterium]
MTSDIQPGADEIAEAAALLRAGGLVAFPTETVYGLGANALDAAAVQRIFAAKGRPRYNPLIVHVPDAAAARALVAEWPDAAARLAARYWPGPLTLVLRKRPTVPDVVTAGLDAVAVRVPAHPVALALLRAAAVPVAAPSANRSTELSPTTAAHVRKSLGDRVDLVLDGGPTSVGIESTVVDLTGARPAILRPGSIGADELVALVGPLAAATASAGAEPRRSPGQLDRHYAPRAALRLAASAQAATRLIAEARAAGRRVGAVLWSVDGFADELRRLPADPAAYARELYATLHALDEAGCDLIVVEAVPENPAWDGVRDRLARAAAPAEAP